MEKETFEYNLTLEEFNNLQAKLVKAEIIHPGATSGSLPPKHGVHLNFAAGSFADPDKIPITLTVTDKPFWCTMDMIQSGVKEVIEEYTKD